MLNFVNHLFASAMGEAYESLSPFEPIQHSPTPTIEFLFATFDADGADANSTPHEGDVDSTKVSAAELRSREADWIARRCAELLSDPTPIQTSFGAIAATELP